jgi:hypothetical protein
VVQTGCYLPKILGLLGMHASDECYHFLKIDLLKGNWV